MPSHGGMGHVVYHTKPHKHKHHKYKGYKGFGYKGFGYKGYKGRKGGFGGKWK